MLIHMGQPLGQQVGVLGRNEVAGLAIADRILDAADIRADDRRAARHRLDGCDAERFVPRHGHEHIGGAVVVFERLPAAPAHEGDQLLDPLLPDDLLQSADLRRQLGVGDIRIAPNEQQPGAEVMLPHQPSHIQQSC